MQMHRAECQAGKQLVVQMRVSILATVSVSALILGACNVVSAAGVGVAVGLVAAATPFGRSETCDAVDVEGNDLYYNRFGRIVTHRTDTRVVVDC
jgi:hypothetical protein